MEYMQGNTEANQRNSDMSDRRANAMRKLEKQRMRRKAAEVPRHGSRHKSAKIPIPPTPPAREVNPSTLNFLFEKRLKYSDVKEDGRVVVPKEFAEKYMPTLEAREGLYIFMDDMTQAKVWRFRYRFWLNNTNIVYVLEKTSEFMKAYGLRVGDFMMIYKDNENQRFAVGVRKSDAEAGDDLSTNNSGVASCSPALTNNTMISSMTTPPYFEENKSQSGSSSSTSGVANDNFQPYRSVPAVATSISSYNDGLQGFPMDLLNMNISELPEF